jgi:hypothetical protein
MIEMKEGGDSFVLLGHTPRAPWLNSTHPLGSALALEVREFSLLTLVGAPNGHGKSDLHDHTKGFPLRPLNDPSLLWESDAPALL